MEDLHNNEMVYNVMQISDLIPTSKSLYSGEYSVVTCALKCLVNIVVKGASLSLEFIRLEGHLQCLEILNDTLAKLQSANNVNETTSSSSLDRPLHDCDGQYDDLLIPIVRLIFVSTRVADGIPSEPRNTLLQRMLLNPVGELLWIYSHVLPTNPTVAVKHHVSDLIRVVINCTIDFGALGTVDTESMTKYIPRFPRLLHTMMRFLEVRASSISDPIHTLHMVVASCLVNVPSNANITLLANEFGQVNPNISKEEATKSLIKHCKTFCNVLELALNDPDQKSVVPFLLWLANVAKGVSSTRKIMLNLLFPLRDLDNEPNGDGISTPKIDEPMIGNLLIKRMTVVDITVKYSTEEFLFCLCDENPDLFVRLTGFGSAAGLLVNRGLLGMGGINNAPSTSRQDIQDMTRAAELSGSSPSTTSITSAPAKSDPEEVYNRMTPEEREQAEAMMERIFALEKKGMVKVVRKGDTFDPNAPPNQKQDEDDKEGNGPASQST